MSFCVILPADWSHIVKFFSGFKGFRRETFIGPEKLYVEFDNVALAKIAKEIASKCTEGLIISEVMETNIAISNLPEPNPSTPLKSAEPSKPPKNYIYIYNVPDRADEETMRQIFGTYGKIESVIQANSFWKITYNDPEAAVDAMYDMNGRDIGAMKQIEGMPTSISQDRIEDPCTDCEGYIYVHKIVPEMEVKNMRYIVDRYGKNDGIIQLKKDIWQIYYYHKSDALDAARGLHYCEISGVGYRTFLMVSIVDPDE